MSEGFVCPGCGGERFVTYNKVWQRTPLWKGFAGSDEYTSDESENLYEDADSFIYGVSCEECGEKIADRTTLEEINGGRIGEASREEERLLEEVVGLLEEYGREMGDVAIHVLTTEEEESYTVKAERAEEVRKRFLTSIERRRANDRAPHFA